MHTMLNKSWSNKKRKTTLENYYKDSEYAQIILFSKTRVFTFKTEFRVVKNSKKTDFGFGKKLKPKTTTQQTQFSQVQRFFSH